MRKKKEEKLRKSQGARLKYEAHYKRHLTNEQLADILGLDNPKTISGYYSGNHGIKDSYLEVLAKLWNIRPEYLKCIDDYPTVEDMAKDMHTGYVKRYTQAIEYFKSIGYEFTPGIYRIYDKKEYFAGLNESDNIFKDPIAAAAAMDSISEERRVSDPDYNMQFAYEVKFKSELIGIYTVNQVEQIIHNINDLILSALSSSFILINLNK